MLFCSTRFYASVLYTPLFALRYIGSIVVLLLSALPLLVFLGNKSTMHLSRCQDVLGGMLTLQLYQVYPYHPLNELAF